MTNCLGKSCSFGLPRMPFVNCCQFMYLVRPRKKICVFPVSSPEKQKNRVGRSDLNFIFS